MVGTLIGTLIKSKFVWVFVCFHSLFPAFLLKRLARSCKIVHIIGALDMILAKILTKGFKKL